MPFPIFGLDGSAVRLQPEPAYPTTVFPSHGDRSRGGHMSQVQSVEIPRGALQELVGIENLCLMEAPSLSQHHDRTCMRTESE